MKRLQQLIVLFVFFHQTGNAQMFDTIARSFREKPSLYFNWGSQYSFISNQFASVTNIKAGVDFGGSFKLGLAYNWLTKKFPVRSMRLEGKSRDARLHFNYAALFAEYSFFRNERWEATIPVQIGAGFSHYSYMNDLAERTHLKKKFFVLYEPMMTIQYRFLRYFGVGCGVGFRLMLINTTVIPEQFISPLLLVKTKLFVGDLWRDITKKT